MFQYATKHRIFADTGLITMEAATGLFEKNRDDFISRLENDEDPEMALWINCNHAGDYDETLHHWQAGDFMVIDGQLYKRV